MKKSYGRRDLDNLNKLVQDGIFQFLGVNDSRVVSLNIEKYNRSGGSYEFIIVKLTPSKIDINKYN
jgi:Holliday junction resolvase RusA-like endonuclease